MNTKIICNDKHSKLNQTRVAKVYHPHHESDVIATIKIAANVNMPVSICGTRHAMGGQQFGVDTMLLDLSYLNDLHLVDTKRGMVEVGAGIMWLELIEGLNAQQAGQKTVWSIRQKQTGADDLTLGGSFAKL